MKTRIVQSKTGYRIERGSFRAIISRPGMWGGVSHEFQIMVKNFADDSSIHIAEFPTLMMACDAVQDRIDGAGIYGYIATRMEV